MNPLHPVRIVIVENDDLRSDGTLSVTVRVNELCGDDSDYPVMVTFGSRPVMGRDEDCEGQEVTSTVQLSSGESHSFSVSVETVTLRDDEEYCYTISVPGMLRDCHHISCQM